MTLIYSSTEHFITPEQQKTAIKLCYVTLNPGINYFQCTRFFFFLRPKTFNQTFFFFSFLICRPPTGLQMVLTCTNSLYLQFVWFSITMQADKQGWNFETKNEISVAFNSEYYPNAKRKKKQKNKSKENILVVDVSYFLSAMKHLWS